MRKVVFDQPIAHRGLHNLAAGVAENSRSAFEAAIAGGFAIECDVQLSSDGEPYIFHDDDLARLTDGKGPSSGIRIADVTALPLKGSSSGDCPQRLSEFLAQIGGRTMLQIELKKQADTSAAMTLANAVVDALRGYQGPYALESFDPRLLIALRRAGATAPLGIVTYAYDEPKWDQDVGYVQREILRHLLHWPITRFDFISCRDRSLRWPAVRFFRSLGLPVTAWTIRSAEQAAAALVHSDQVVFEGYLPGG